MSLEKKPRKAVAKKGVTKKSAEVIGESPALQAVGSTESISAARKATARTKATPTARKTAPKSFQVNIDDLIRLRAYEIYLRRGATPGNQQEDWQLAEREVREHFGAQLGQEADA